MHLLRICKIGAAFFSPLLVAGQLSAFEGRINAVIVRGGETAPLLYTVGTNSMRVEMTATNWPNPVDVLDLDSGALTLVFPHNRSYVRLKAAPDNSPPPPGFPAGLPGGTPQTQNPEPPPAVIGPTNLPGLPTRPEMPAMPLPPNAHGLPPGIGPQSGNNPAVAPMPMGNGMAAMPMMPMPGETPELQATTNTMTILGFPCVRYDLRRRGETMEIWATDKLTAFQPYVQNQPTRFGPRMIEEQWGELLKAKNLFPLRATLKFDQGAERLQFEVKTITPQKIEDVDRTLFQPPPDYHELVPLPF